MVEQRPPGGLLELLDRGRGRLGEPDPDRVQAAFRQPFAFSLAVIFLFQKPESARTRISPLPPARRTRAISSSTKRGAPRWVCAEPVRSRTCNTSSPPARVAGSGW
jgi:hypothetical protein